MIDFSTLADGNAFDLAITLTNTGDAPTTTAAILTGLYFDISSGVPQGALGMSSAVANDGLIDATNVVSGVGANICAPGVGGTATSPSCSSTVAGGWEAGYFLNGIPATGDHYGIGTSGQSGIFNGNGTSGVGNANYAIAPSSGITSSNAITNEVAYTYTMATFTLTGLTSSDITISNVFAAYGTAPEFTPAGVPLEATVPEPATMAEFAAGALLLAFGSRRRWSGRR
jgi:hypothetical protein